jgi:hypothetical protein
MILASLASVISSVTLAHAALGGALTPAVADSLPFDTTQVVVADSDFTKLKAFLQATVSEWGKPEIQGLMQRHILQYPMAIGSLPGVTIPAQLSAGTPIPIPNYAVVADSVPAVASGLSSAKLTAQRYLQLSRTLNAAWVTEQLDRLGHNGTPQMKDTTTVIGKNVAYIRAHQADFNQLVQLALDVVTFRQQQGGMGGMGGGNDLNP